MKELLIATTNPGKLSEYNAIFKEYKLAVKTVSLKELRINREVEETGQTFKENAVQKALFYCNLSGLPTLSDDAGLEIDYLSGEPGVNSRRWPGYKASDKELMQMALDKLKGVPREQRGAQLRAVIALAFPKEKKIYTFEGVLRGRIAEKSMIIKSVPGYPFRSIFIPADGNKYLGEMSVIAHRRQAVEKAIPLLIKKLLI